MASQQFQPQAQDCCVPLALVFIFHLLRTKESRGAQSLMGVLVQLQTRSFGCFGCTACLRRNAVFTLPSLQALYCSLGRWQLPSHVGSFLPVPWYWLLPLPGTPFSLLYLAIPNSTSPLLELGTRAAFCRKSSLTYSIEPITPFQVWVHSVHGRGG